MALPDANKLVVIDLATMQPRRPSRSANPQEVLVRPDGKAAYVSCMSGNQVAEIDLAWTVARNIATGRGTDGLAWAKGE